MQNPHGQNVQAADVGVLPPTQRLAAIAESVGNRIRPILMTTTTTVLGLLPRRVGRITAGGAVFHQYMGTVENGQRRFNHDRQIGDEPDRPDQREHADEDEQLIEHVIADIEKIGFVDRSSIVYRRVVRFRYGYPVYDLEYREKVTAMRASVVIVPS